MAGRERRWTTRKKDAAPKGVFRHKSGVWAVRFTCGVGHIHQERVGTLKSAAISSYHERRKRTLDEPGWCPATERSTARQKALDERSKERARMTFGDYARDFMKWAQGYHRSWAKDDSRLSRVLPVLKDRKLDAVTTADIERLLDSLTIGERAVSPATRNRYRDLLSGMFKRAVRLGLVPSNPITAIPKVREAGGRVLYATPEEERAIHDALPAHLRPLFTVSLHTGMRWSEQARLRWKDIDMLAGVVTVTESKNGRSRQVPMNSRVRSVLIDQSAGRRRPGDPDEPVFRAAYRTTARAFERAIGRAQEALRDAGKGSSRLDGYTWHGNRHTFASRLVMAGVDLRTVQELGGWRTLGMVQRYGHLAPSHLADAVERLVEHGTTPRRPNGDEQLRRNFNEPESAVLPDPRGVS